jgi:hypothetical protein
LERCRLSMATRKEEGCRLGVNLGVNLGWFHGT